MLKRLLLILLISCFSCPEISNNWLLGEWTLELENCCYTPDTIIFRSDNNYQIYNDMDFVAQELNKEYNIICDDGSGVTAVVEVGKWCYDQSNHQLTLLKRNFIKKNSLFSKLHGKEKKLLFSVQRINNNQIILRSLKSNGTADGYIKNWTPTSKTGDTVFYKEVNENYSNCFGTQTKEIILSGLEIELRIKYGFPKAPGKIVFENRKGEELFSTEMEITNGVQTKQIPLRGVTRLIIKVICADPSTIWDLEVDIK